MCAIWWSFHQTELLGASSETTQSTFGKSFRVSITFSTYASWKRVMALGAVMATALIPCFPLT